MPIYYMGTGIPKDRERAHKKSFSASNTPRSSVEGNKQAENSNAQIDRKRLKSYQIKKALLTAKVKIVNSVDLARTINLEPS